MALIKEIFHTVHGNISSIRFDCRRYLLYKDYSEEDLLDTIKFARENKDKYLKIFLQEVLGLQLISKVFFEKILLEVPFSREDLLEMGSNNIRNEYSESKIIDSLEGKFEVSDKKILIPHTMIRNDGYKLLWIDGIPLSQYRSHPDLYYLAEVKIPDIKQVDIPVYKFNYTVGFHVFNVSDNITIKRIWRKGI